VIKFLHAADIHLDSPLLKLNRYEGAPATEIRGATRRAFENLVDIALAEQVDFIVIAGDLYDSDWKDFNTGLYFVGRMARLREAGIRVLLASGNHDAASSITRSLRLPENVHLFPHQRPGTFALERLNVAVHGQSFATAAVRTDLSRHFPDPMPGCFNIGLLHTCLNGREGHEPYAPCRLEALCEKGYDYWALGHVHQREVLSESPLVVFPGNTQGRHARETGPKGCMLVQVDERRSAEAVFRPLDVVRWETVAVDAAGAASAYDVLDRFRAALPAVLSSNPDGLSVVRVRVDGATAVHDELRSDPERWENEIRAAACEEGADRLWVEKVRLATEPLSRDTEGDPGGALGLLLEMIDEIRSDPSRLDDLAAELSELERKLPRDVREVAGAQGPARSEWLAGVLTECRSMLVHRLTKGGTAA
jgi:DNA repair exonuclease SbcCD nuclease subunit